MIKRKYQEGGQLTDTQQQGLQYLAQMYAQQTGKDPQQDQEGFMQFVQQLAQQAGVQDIGQLLDMIYQQAQGQAQAAKHGAKLNYLKRLSGKCPEGTELMYFKAGGRVCSKCVNKKVKKEACGKKMKLQNGSRIIQDQTSPLRSLSHPEEMYSDSERNGVVQRKWHDGEVTYVPYDKKIASFDFDQNILKDIFFLHQDSGPSTLPNVEVIKKKGKKGVYVTSPHYNPFRSGREFDEGGVINQQSNGIKLTKAQLGTKIMDGIELLTPIVGTKKIYDEKIKNNPNRTWKDWADFGLSGFSDALTLTGIGGGLGYLMKANKALKAGKSAEKLLRKSDILNEMSKSGLVAGGTYRNLAGNGGVR